MRQTAVVLSIVLATASGCGAAKSALGALGGGTKPSNITVVNEITVAAPAPAPAPAAGPVVIAAPEHKSGAISAVVGGALAGAFAGAMVGAYHRTDAAHVGTGAVIGAGAGAAVGYLVHATD